jgi:hypothetical protein
MLEVFVSSIQRDYSDVRESARRAIESLDMRPLMAELAGAHAESPQRALLDLVGRADVFLLLVGPRYSSPTEDEFNEANRLGKPILVLRQNGELEPEQQAFLERVAAGWSGGRLWGAFGGAGDVVALATVKALTNVQGKERADLAPAAHDRAHALAAAPSGSGHGSVARIAFAPLLSRPLLDALALDRAGLGDEVATLVRGHALVAQSVGIRAEVTGTGISVQPVGPYANAPSVAFVGADGVILGVVDVGGGDQFGSSRVDPDRLRSAITSVGAFALESWAMIDEREEVQQAAVALVIPDAQHKVFGTPTNPNSLSMGWGLPQTVAVPNTPFVLRRAEVAGDKLAARLVAEVKRVFADSRALAQ